MLWDNAWRLGYLQNFYVAASDGRHACCPADGCRCQVASNFSTCISAKQHAIAPTSERNCVRTQLRGRHASLHRAIGTPQAAPAAAAGRCKPSCLCHRFLLHCCTHLLCFIVPFVQLHTPVLCISPRAFEHTAWRAAAAAARGGMAAALSAHEFLGWGPARLITLSFALDRTSVP